MKKMALLLLFAFAGTAQAGVLTLNNIDSGWYNATGFHDPNNNNYIVGNYQATGGSPQTYNNFLVFDLGGIAGKVTSATLRLFTGFVNVTGGVIAPRTYSMFDVSTSVSSLVAGGSGLTGIYNDLGSGAFYGSVSFLPTQDNQFVDVTLNSHALADINAAGGLFAIGGTYNGVGRWDYAFGTSNDQTNRLILNTVPVPEPSIVALLGIGIAALGFTRRRRFV